MLGVDMVTLTKHYSYLISGFVIYVCSYCLVNTGLAASSAIGQIQNLSNQVAPITIIIDNARKSWELTTPYANDPIGDNGGIGQVDWNTITMAHDCDDLNIRYYMADGPSFRPDGFRYNLFLDIDKNPMTGYRGSSRQLSVGSDVLIQGGQDKVTVYKFTAGADQLTWQWQEVNYYPVNDQAKVGGGRDINYQISISDLDVFGTGVTGFNWVAWADQPSNLVDYFPDRGNLGDTGEFNTYTFNYQPKADSFANPERGFYEATKTHSAKYKPVDLATLQCYRQNEAVSLVHRFFYLEGFANSDISQQYLDLMQADFDKIRQAGLKVIPRFAYSETAGPNLSPPYGDASKERILSHLNQLSVVLKKNSDVIAVMQAGFIGLWGEWWFSDYFQPDTNWNERTEVLFGILDALPANRSVQLRTPRYKQNIFGDSLPVDQATSHNGSDRARTGHHNDCFLSSKTDGGTYINALAENPYLQEETKWLPMGGETCDFNSLADLDPNRLMCATALEELAALHWSFLNVDWYQPNLRKWLDDGCYAEIERRLGYQLSFLQGTYNDQIKPGGLFKFNLQLKNEGFSAPFNPRAVELILRHSDGTAYPFKLANDPRLWLPGNIYVIAGEIVIPQNLPVGNYEVLLNLPDPEPSLHSRPEYSIRLTNGNGWEAKTGFNKLNHTAAIVPSVYYPNAIGITVGKYDWGNLASLLADDDDTYDISSSPILGGKSTDWYASTKVINGLTNISKLSLIYKGQYSIRNVLQTVYLYNYKTSSWDLLDRRTVGNTNDVTVSSVITNNPSKYVSANGEMKVRVRGFSTNRSFDCWANMLNWSVN
jgi:hypothetical protein